MPAIPPVSASTPAAVSTPTNSPKQTLDSEVFLQLLVTQLRNQDPSSPMDTNEMMGQTTQLAQMEQITLLTQTTSESFALSMRQTATALVGHDATYLDANGVAQSGRVSKVSFEQSIPTVTIGDTTIPLDAISGVSAS